MVFDDNIDIKMFALKDLHKNLGANAEELKPVLKNRTILLGDVDGYDCIPTTIKPLNYDLHSIADVLVHSGSLTIDTRALERLPYEIQYELILKFKAGIFSKCVIENHKFVSRGSQNADVTLENCKCSHCIFDIENKRRDTIRKFHIINSTCTDVKIGGFDFLQIKNGFSLEELKMFLTKLQWNGISVDRSLHSFTSNNYNAIQSRCTSYMGVQERTMIKNGEAIKIPNWYIFPIPSK